MNIQNHIRLGLIILLCFLYSIVFWLMLHPKVSDEYRRYYINRETIDWRPPHYPATVEQHLGQFMPR